MNTFKCTHCNKTKPVKKSGGTGYAENRETGKKTCYECMGAIDAAEMINAIPGTRFVHYLTIDSKLQGLTPFCATVSNWPGSMKLTARLRVGNHNIAGKRFDIWFQLGGQQFHGTTYGENTQICHIKKLKP